MLPDHVISDHFATFPPFRNANDVCGVNITPTRLKVCSKELLVSYPAIPKGFLYDERDKRKDWGGSWALLFWSSS